MRSLLILIGCLLCLSTGPAHADKRVALVIGESKYQKVPRLINPARDADAIAALFKQAGFEVINNQRDVGIVELRRVIREFAETARDADIAVVYYAGHGIEVDGTNYLVPAHAKLASDFDIEDETISLDRVLKALEGTRRLRLVILDACRDNPFANTMKRSIASRSMGRGLAKVEPTMSDTLVAFAAKAGAVAADGDGANSPFAAALVKYIAEPGLDLRIAFGRVRDDVLKATSNRQEPFVYGSLGGQNMSLVPAPAKPASRDEAGKLAALTPDQTQPKTPLSPRIDQADINRLLQAHLKRVGCNSGNVDGNWDDSSRKALELFNKNANTTFDVKVASLDALDTVRARTDRVCPLICAKGQKDDGGRCVQISCDAGYFMNSSDACEKRPEPAPKPRTVERNREPRHRAAPTRGGKCFSFNGSRFCE